MEIWCFCNSNLVSLKGFNGILFPLTIFYSSKLNFSNKQKFDQNFFFVILQQLVLSFSEIILCYTKADQGLYLLNAFSRNYVPREFAFG